MLKKTLCLALVLTLAFSLTACINDGASQEEISSFVTEHIDLIKECIAANKYTELEKYDIIKDVNVYINDVVEFYCDGAGLGSETMYCGFYYTESGEMSGLSYVPVTEIWLSPSGNGFLWQEDFGDNEYYTEKIADNFFYFKATY